MHNPLSIIVEALEGHSCNPKTSGTGYAALCPAHEDHNPSLSVSEGADGRVLLNCHAGCETDAVMRELGLPMKALFTKQAKPQTTAVLEKIYQYMDASKTLIYEVRRYSPKAFKQCRPRGIGQGSQRIWNLNGIERVLYRLPEILEAKAAGKTIFIAEGEKDVESLVSIGIDATCNSGGAGKWQESYSEALQGTSAIVIIADKDPAGRKHAPEVATSMYGKCGSIKVIEMPDRNGTTVKDAADWIQAGGTVSELMAISGEARAWTPAVQQQAEQFYYDSARKEYLLRNSRGVWLGLTETQFRKELASRGYNPKPDKTELVSKVDSAIISIRDKNDIQYAGALAGHKAGFYSFGEYRVLVTTSPKLIEPVQGSCPTLDAFISGLLDEGGLRQRDFLYGWIKIGYEALRAGLCRSGQALTICGPADCGKSVLQLILTEIFGGRYAKPYQFMMGLTQFNSDLFEAEHLMLEDEQSSRDFRTRQNFGAQIKNVTVNESQRCHAKNRVAVPLKPFWRLSITLNEEPENLMVLPPIDDSLEDKIIILRAHKTAMPMPTQTSDQRTAFFNQLLSELPAFLHRLLAWEIPAELKSDRFGITHFHHPEILAEIDGLSPEARLLSLIDKILFSNPGMPWEGTANDLEKELTAESPFEANRLFTFNTACGVYLGRLAKKYPTRFIYHHQRNSRQWTIHPDPSTPAQTQRVTG